MKKLFPVITVLLIAYPLHAQVSLGTSASVTNPQRSGDATTGLFSAATGSVSVSSAGTEIMRVNGTGVGIGTTSPGAILDVNGTTNLRNTFIQSGGYMYFGNYNTGAGGIYPSTAYGALAVADNFSNGNAETDIWNTFIFQALGHKPPALAGKVDFSPWFS